MYVQYFLTPKVYFFVPLIMSLLSWLTQKIKNDNFHKINQTRANLFVFYQTYLVVNCYQILKYEINTFLFFSIIQKVQQESWLVCARACSHAECKWRSRERSGTPCSMARQSASPARPKNKRPGETFKMSATFGVLIKWERKNLATKCLHWFKCSNFPM